MLSFRKFIETERDSNAPSLYQAADDELNTDGQVGIQVFDWVGPFDDGIYRFGQAFSVVKDSDNADGTITIKPVTAKEHGDEDAKVDSPIKLNVMKCCRRHPVTKEIMQVKCPPLTDTKEFPIKKKEWTQMVNKPFAQQAGGAGGMGGGMGMGGLPGM